MPFEQGARLTVKGEHLVSIHGEEHSLKDFGLGAWGLGRRLGLGAWEKRYQVRQKFEIQKAWTQVSGLKSRASAG
jgi:hypothetical protein